MNFTVTGSREAEKPPRFYLDERVGCVAVRDRTLDANKIDEPGLHDDTAGVVWYTTGVRVEVECRECRHKTSKWAIHPEDLAAAKTVCDALNGEADDPKPAKEPS